MRFSLRQLLIFMAFFGLATAYITQSLRFSALISRHSDLEEKHEKVREAIEAMALIKVSDEGPDMVSLQVPPGWPMALKDEWNGVPAGEVPAVMASRLSHLNPRISSSSSRQSSSSP